MPSRALPVRDSVKAGQGPRHPYPTLSVERGARATYLPTATRSYLYWRKLLMPRRVRASTR